MCYSETITTYSDGRDPGTTSTIEIVDNSLCCGDGSGEIEACPRGFEYDKGDDKCYKTFNN